MEEYGVTQPEQIRAVATSSVREAENRDTSSTAFTSARASTCARSTKPRKAA